MREIKLVGLKGLVSSYSCTIVRVCGGNECSWWGGDEWAPFGIGEWKHRSCCQCSADILAGIAGMSSGLLWNEGWRVYECVCPGVMSVVRTWWAIAAVVGVQALAKGMGLGRSLRRNQNHLPGGQSSCQEAILALSVHTKGIRKWGGHYNQRTGKRCRVSSVYPVTKWAGLNTNCLPIRSYAKSNGTDGKKKMGTARFYPVHLLPHPPLSLPFVAHHSPLTM